MGVGFEAALALVALAIGGAIGALARHAAERRAREAFAAHWREELRATGEGRDRALADKRELEQRLERERETSDNATARLRRLRDERDQARERASGATTEIESLEAQLGELRDAFERISGERSDLSARLGETEATIVATTRDGEETARRAAALGDEATALREELERIRASHDGCPARIDELSRQRVAAERELREMRAVADRARGDETERRAGAERSHARERKAWREREAALETELGETRDTIAELRKEVERLGRRLAERAAAAATLETAVAVAGDRSASAKIDAVRTRDELARLRELVDERTLALAASPPAWLLDAARGEPDELCRIRGIGEVIESRLHELGVFHLSQLAAMSDDDRRWLAAHLGVPDSRIARERWADQARGLLAAGDGDSTEDLHDERRVRGRQST